MAKENITSPAGVLIICEPNHYENSPTADDAFPSRLTSLSKQRESIISCRASSHMAPIQHKSSPVTDDAFPPRLTSLSKQRESFIRHWASYHMAIINTKAARELTMLFRSF